jgi:hypothetical protein
MSCASIKNNELPLCEESSNFILYSNVKSQYNQAIIKICESSLEAYENEFNLDLHCRNSEKYRIYIDQNTINDSKLFISNNSEINLCIKSEIELIPPSMGGPHHIYGFAHEIGHTAIRFIDRDFDEGFATYLGISCVKYISSQLGKSAWPFPYDYEKYDGVGRLPEFGRKAKTQYDISVAVALFNIERRYGKGPIIRAISKTRDIGKTETPVDLFIINLEQECNDYTIGEMFSKKRFNWRKLDPRAKNLSFDSLIAEDNFEKRTNMMLDNWNGNIYGIIDGHFVELCLQSIPGDENKKRVILPSGITIQKADDGYLQVFYDDERCIAYVIGKAMILENSVEVSNTKIDKSGNKI